MDDIGRVLIIGGGAIGTYIGVSLAHQGQEVVLLERDQDLPRLQESGLTLEYHGAEITASEVKFISNLQQIREGDIGLVILALKTYHLAEVIPELRQLREHIPALLCLQNGVESENKLRVALGQNRVIAGTVTSAVDRIRKGHALVRKQRGTGLAGRHPLMNCLLPVFEQAGLNPRYYPRPEAMKWSKLLTNLLGNASSAILDISTSQIYSNRDLYQMELAQIREALQVMHQLGLAPVNLPGVPVRVLASLVRWLPAAISQPLVARAIGGGRGEKMPSFHIDLHSGRGVSEVDQLNGAVVRYGERVGVATPVNRFLNETLLSLIEEKIPLERYRENPAQFLQDMHQTQMDFNG